MRAGSIVVSDPDGSRRVPIETIDAVMIVGHGQITTDALALCAQKRIGVTGLTGSGRVKFVAGGAMGGNVFLRLRQYRAADNDMSSLSVARMLVVGKLANAERALKRWSWDAPMATRRKLKRLGLQVAEQADKVWDAKTGDHARGCEGNGTRAYFAAVRLHLENVRPDLSFEARTRRPPRDPVNALLSYCYGLALAEIAGALEAVGLDPQVGFLHGVRPGRPSLALDVLEEFRTGVTDRFALGLLARRQLGEEAFTPTVGGGWYLSDQGKRRLFEAWEDYRSEEIIHPLLERTIPRASLAATQATLMARFLRGDLPSYPPYVGPA